MSTSTSYRSNCFNLEISLPSNKPERNKWPNGLSILEDFITDEEHEELVNFIRQYSSTSFTRIGWLLASDSLTFMTFTNKLEMCNTRYYIFNFST